MTGSKALRRWSVTIVVAAVATATACSTSTKSVSDQPTPTESTTAATETTAPTQTTPTEEPPVTGIVKGDDGWSTYTNAELGFTFRFPTRTYAYNGAPCAKVQEGNDWSYRPADGVVPATVVQDGSRFWVVQKISWQLGDEVKSNGSSKFKSCTKTTTTAAMLRAYDTGQSDFSLNPLPMTVSPVAARAQVKENVRTYFYGCPTIRVVSIDRNGGGWRDVRYTCPSDSTYPGAMIDVRWYKAQGLFAVFEFGQAYHIYNTKQKPVDQRIVASFATLY